MTERTELTGGPAVDPRDTTGPHPDDQESLDDFGEVSFVRLDELEPDFNDEQGVADAILATETAEPWFPPTDPVILPESNDRGGARVLGDPADEDEDELDSYLGEEPGLMVADDALARAVYDALRGDAQTIDLSVEVWASRGVVTLRGEVPTLDDAEAAEAVASRVPGVVEVREEFTIQSL